ncbi:DUF4132 domain-containing protein [Streptomyces roseicoloratus]|uniref:DUF4132 domain-containing protein n=1 Tax=Streptomyces roseicoloratus TaxID=2508722 RepID=UPI001009A109|nr:DUF4132 domain-containing protein [Streptomyces roseicoloratus]
MRRWEHAGDGSAKFWEAGVDGASVTVRFGRTGTAGQTRVKEFGSADAAESYLVKAIGEKERKGYAEVGEAAGAPDVTGAASAAEPAAAAPLVRPDEDTFALPAAWKRNLRPRRGGTQVDVRPAEEHGAANLRQWRRQFTRIVDRALDATTSDAGLVAVARAHESGLPDPTGAAVIGTLLPADVSPRALADAWTGAHGLPFAACAAVELLECRAKWTYERVNQPSVCGIETASEDENHWQRGFGYDALDRVRALLAVADDDTYAAAVTALAGHRTGPRRKAAVSYLVPTERAWVDECLADPAVREHPQLWVRDLVLNSTGSASHLAAYGGRIDLGWHGWTAATVATVADGVGPLMAPLMATALDLPYIGGDDLKAMAAALAELPVDEAFQALVDRLGNKHVRAAAAAAARRYPVRALRLLAAAADGTGPHASMAGRILAAHVATHDELVREVLPELPATVAATVRPLAEGTDPADEAPQDALPALLTSPPWTVKRTAVKPEVVEGLTPPAVSRIHWLPGEQKDWACATSWISGWQPWQPMEKMVEELRSGRLPHWHAVGVFTHGPADAVRPLLADWKGPDHAYEGVNLLKPMIATHELAALPPALRAARHEPTHLAPILLPFLDTEVARLMAEWLHRLKTAGRTARVWFARHGADAARLLVPDAVGAPGPARTAAEGALRAVADTHGEDAVRTAAKEYGEEAATAVEALLTSDPLVTALPARMPKPVAWAEPRILPRPRLRDGGTALPAQAVAHVLTMIAVSKPGMPYPGIARLHDLCTPTSLAEFAWALFEEWRVAGMPPKEAWALHALGWLGDDDTVRALTPVIRAWPGEGAHQRAVDGLDVLAAIGTDTALLHLHGISQRVKFKALKQRAQEKIATVAAELGLTGEQLADRLVPDLGLDPDGSTVVDYGTRRFTVGFDEQLKPYVRDEAGRRLKDLPKPGARDDTERATAERKRFLTLKKDVRTIAADQVRRLESAMVERRSWTGAEFRQLFVEHPLVWHLARRLVWHAEHEGRGLAFRIAEDRTYADVDDETVTVAEAATVTLPHPLHLAEELDGWAELFADYEIVQPFPQLGRPVLTVTGEEATGARLPRFEGITVPVGKLLGLQKRGWERGEPQDAGVERWFSRRLGPERHLVIGLDPGIAVGIVNEFPDQRLDTIWLDKHPGDHWASRSYPLRFADLDPVTVSEILADLTELTS